MVVVERERGPTGRRSFGFDALTLVPFDQRLLDLSLLTRTEVRWLNEYHQRVRDALSPLVGDTEKVWLEQATAAIELQAPRLSA